MGRVLYMSIRAYLKARLKRATFLAGCLFFIMVGCSQEAAIDSETARLMITHRNLGLAYLEESKLLDARD